MKTRITLSESDIKEAISEWLSKKIGPKVWVVTLGTEAVYRGYGASEYTDHEVVITAEPKEVDKPKREEPL